jgi:hypothetical protein
LQVKQELLEHRRRIGDQEDMSSLRNSGLVRQWLTVLLTITAWVLLSNHCALGAVALPVETGVEASGCPMHSAPAKKKPATKTPCCRDIRAVVAKTVTAAAIPAQVIGAQTFPAELVAPPPRFQTEIALLDTGPPGCVSFAESVLQESLLAHAPPVS